MEAATENKLRLLSVNIKYIHIFVCDSGGTFVAGSGPITALSSPDVDSTFHRFKQREETGLVERKHVRVASYVAGKGRVTSEKSLHLGTEYGR
jgi:hypothetical protein